ncbi:MAG TPA: class I SAM-dependent methyltransferase [Chloroflexota bacterium]
MFATPSAPLPRNSPRTYFGEIEHSRYTLEPEIVPFAQFTSARGKKVLEVGVGAGTDFIQWVRAGASAFGIDLTEEAIEHTRQRLMVDGLRSNDLCVADAEALPYASNTFDIVYSWGVIHHTPDTERALSEIVRVCQPGGQIRIMIYNRHSLLAFRTWVRFALLRGHPERSIGWALAHHVESPGTRAFTALEARRMLSACGVGDIHVQPMLTSYDVLDDLGGIWEACARALASLLGGDRVG